MVQISSLGGAKSLNILLLLCFIITYLGKPSLLSCEWVKLIYCGLFYLRPPALFLVGL